MSRADAVNDTPTIPTTVCFLTLGIACLITAAFLAGGLPAALGIFGGTLVLIALA